MYALYKPNYKTKSSRKQILTILHVNVNYSLRTPRLHLAWFSLIIKKLLMKTLSALLLAMLTVSFASAQLNEGPDYKTAIGVKVYPGAITVKHFIANNRAVEGLGYISSDGFRLTGLYELHNDIVSVTGLKWYAGAGGHVGVWSDTWRTKYPTRNDGMAIGIDGVLGLDYKLSGIPLNLSFDWQPSFNIIGYNYFEGGWGGIGIRYTF
jgi:hypothetical protein